MFFIANTLLEHQFIDRFSSLNHKTSHSICTITDYFCSVKTNSSLDIICHWRKSKEKGQVNSKMAHFNKHFWVRARNLSLCLLKCATYQQPKWAVRLQIHNEILTWELPGSVPLFSKQRAQKLSVVLLGLLD